MLLQGTITRHPMIFYWGVSLGILSSPDQGIFISKYFHAQGKVLEVELAQYFGYFYLTLLISICCNANSLFVCVIHYIFTIPSRPLSF